MRICLLSVHFISFHYFYKEIQTSTLQKHKIIILVIFTQRTLILSLMMLKKSVIMVFNVMAYKKNQFVGLY